MYFKQSTVFILLVSYTPKFFFRHLSV